MQNELLSKLLHLTELGESEEVRKLLSSTDEKLKGILLEEYLCAHATSLTPDILWTREVHRS